MSGGVANKKVSVERGRPTRVGLLARGVTFFCVPDKTRGIWGVLPDKVWAKSEKMCLGGR